MTDVEEFIKRVTRVYNVTEGKVSATDMEEIFKCLRQLDAIKKIVDDCKNEMFGSSHTDDDFAGIQLEHYGKIIRVLKEDYL